MSDQRILVLFCTLFSLVSTCPAKASDPIAESQAAAQRIKQAEQRLAYFKAKATQASAEQKARYERQLEADRKAEIEIEKINAQTKKYQKDLAIAEFNQKRSEIALAYAHAKTKRQKQLQQKVFQRKIASERQARTSRN